MGIRCTIWKIIIGIGIFCLKCESTASPPPFPEGVDAIALSPDGQIVAAAGRGLKYGIKVWSVSKRFSYLGVPNGEWQHLGFLPDGQMLHGLTRGAMHAWEVTTGKQKLIHRGGLEPYFAFTVAPDWKRIGQVTVPQSSNSEYELRIQNIGKVALLIPNAEPNSSLRFSPDGQMLASVGIVQQTNELTTGWVKTLSGAKTCI